MGTGRIENLQHWKPGQSGNPGGKHKKHSVIWYIEQALMDEVRFRDADGKVSKIKRAEFLGQQLVHMAIKLLTDVQAGNEMDRSVLQVYRDALTYVLKHADPSAVGNGKSNGNGTPVPTELIVKNEAGALFAEALARVGDTAGRYGPAQHIEAFRQSSRAMVKMKKEGGAR